MSEEEKPKPKPIKFESDGKLQFRENPDGSLSGTSDKPVNMHIEMIKSVGVENLVDIEVHTINNVFNSVSHYIKFFGGGEVRFSYNSKGEILEFTGKNVNAQIVNGERLILKRKPSAGDKGG